MSSNLSKRLELIRDQVDGHDGRRLGFKRTTFLYFLAGAVLCSVLGSVFDETAVPERGFASANDEFHQRMRTQVIDRVRWLNGSIFGESAGEFYREFSSVILTSSEEDDLRGKDPIEIEFWTYITTWFGQVASVLLLQIVFTLIVAWPFWFLGILGGYLWFRYAANPKPTQDILGICSRNRGPFYSGIYGPLRPNNSASGTDYSCPGLACPVQAPKPEVLKHGLVKILRHYGGFNETTLDLCRVIVAYKDLPSFVEEERILEEEPDAISPLQQNTPQASISPIRSNEEGTIEGSALEGLDAVLSAHRVLTRYFHSKEGKYVSEADDELRFGVHRQRLEKVAPQLKPLARVLLMALTPPRGRALAELPPNVIAAAYLSTEAGKSLVFKRDGKAYIQFSRFPHLQARAVLQSLLSFHQEYSGDARMLIRQAIICSRRHGDFGRAFLPVSMAPSSRALRDWLEILYAPEKRRPDVANIVELDAQIEEIHNNFRGDLSRRMEGSLHHEKAISGDVRAILWKGLPYKSVVLIPLKELIDSALSGMSKERLQRIGELIQLTRKLQASLSISARLPGFKRQAVEAEKGSFESGGVTKQLAESEGTADLVERWLVVRRMLTRYNWLSTRIGDDAVPVDGLVQGLVLAEKEGEKREVVPLPALVPVRQRRYKDLFGSKWEYILYTGAPHQTSIDVFVSPQAYNDGLKTRREQTERGSAPTAKEQVGS